MADPNTTSTPPESAADETEREAAAASLGPTAREASKGASAVPDWAPWVVLGSLVSFGLLGGMGVLPVPDFRPAAASPKAAAPTATAQAQIAPVLKPRAQPSAASSAGADEKIEVHHLVVSHAGTQLGRHHNISRTAEEAKKRAIEARARAIKGEDFAALVTEYTDEPKASGRNGRLGPFRRKHAVKPFSDVAFALKVNEISEVTETAFGFHVIKRLQ